MGAKDLDALTSEQIEVIRGAHASRDLYHEALRRAGIEPYLAYEWKARDQRRREFAVGALCLGVSAAIVGALGYAFSHLRYEGYSYRPTIENRDK